MLSSLKAESNNVCFFLLYNFMKYFVPNSGFEIRNVKIQRRKWKFI